MSAQFSHTIGLAATILSDFNLNLPIYQRAYKWNTLQVSQLLEDLIEFKNSEDYRLGTLVLHQVKKEHYDIVDGQQRCTTLLLLFYALRQRFLQIKKTERTVFQERIINLSWQNLSFKDPVSKKNIKANYRKIQELLSNFDEESLGFLLERCKFVVFILNDVSEAFQFFDSQNARGKDLAPHDLLKAYHLREFSSIDEIKKKNVVSKWEELDTDTLMSLFGDNLYRIKGWIKGNSSRYFTKNEIHYFKGVNLSKVNIYTYASPLKILNAFVDNYNEDFARRIDGQFMEFPFQIDQPIINGRRFFEMVSHYYEVFNQLKEKLVELDLDVKNIFNVINNYSGSKRTGDAYVRNLFYTALIYYVDKFGFIEMNMIVKKAFNWAYNLRLQYEALQFSSVDNYVLFNANLFKVIHNAFIPNEVVLFDLSTISEVKATKVSEILDLYNQFNFYYPRKGATE